MLRDVRTRLLAYLERRRQAELARLTDGRTSTRYGPSFYSPATNHNNDHGSPGASN